jgi:hypothetical protein
MKKYIYEKKNNFLNTNAYWNILIRHSSQIARANDLWQLKTQIFQKLLLLHIIFLEKLFYNKKFGDKLLDILSLFFTSVFSSIFKGLFISPSNFLTRIK